MFPIIQIGPAAVQVPGLIILVGIWLGIVVMERKFKDSASAEQERKTGIVEKNILNNLILIALLAVVLGARLSFIIQYPSAFVGNPLNILSPNPGLLDFKSGIVIGGLAALVYGRSKRLNFVETLDALTPFFGVISIAIHFSNMASGNAFGSPTDLLWAINLWGETRHPTQVYEFLGSCIILWLIWPGRYQNFYSVTGRRFLIFVSTSALARIFFEAFRGDSTLLPLGIRSAQVIAWFILLGSLWGLWKLAGKKGISSKLPEISPDSDNQEM